MHENFHHFFAEPDGELMKDVTNSGEQYSANKYYYPLPDLSKKLICISRAEERGKDKRGKG